MGKSVADQKTGTIEKKAEAYKQLPSVPSARASRGRDIFDTQPCATSISEFQKETGTCSVYHFACGGTHMCIEGVCFGM